MVIAKLKALSGGILQTGWQNMGWESKPAEVYFYLDKVATPANRLRIGNWIRNKAKKSCYQLAVGSYMNL